MNSWMEMLKFRSSRKKLGHIVVLPILYLPDSRTQEMFYTENRSDSMLTTMMCFGCEAFA